MYIQEDDLKLNDWQFSQRKYLPYETKLRLTETRIREWHYNWDGQVYLSYSAGLDSTVLLHMIRKILGNDVPAVFSNTGLEFPEIVRFARKAKMNGKDFIRALEEARIKIELSNKRILFMHPEDIAILDLDKVSNVIYLVEERRLEHGKVIAITDEKLKRAVLDAIKNNKVKYHRGRKK